MCQTKRPGQEGHPLQSPDNDADLRLAMELYMHEGKVSDSPGVDVSLEAVDTSIDVDGSNAGDDVMSTVAAYLDSRGLTYVKRDDAFVFPITHKMLDAENTWLVVIKKTATTLAVWSFWNHQEEVPAQHRLQMLEYITRVNFNLPIGCFDFDIEDGELRYTTSFAHSCIPVTTPSSLLHYLPALLDANLVTYHRYLPGIDMIVNQNGTATEALKAVDAVVHSDPVVEVIKIDAPPAVSVTASVGKLN